MLSITTRTQKEIIGRITIDIVGHATVLLQLGDIKVLCDPHLFKDFRGSLFGYYPARKVDIVSLPIVDAVILSHSHRDHFDVASLYEIDRRKFLHLLPS